LAKPGIMLYFDVLEPIRALPDREKGRLLTAMLEYGQTGKAPEFTGRLALAWGFVKPRIDRDEEEYNRIALKKQYANYCKEQKKKGEPEMGFEEWSATARNDHVEPRGTTRNPTTATTTYITFPILCIIGIKVLAKVLALVDKKHNSSLTLSKPIFDSSS